MKKIFIYAIVLVFGLFFITSCEKDKIGGTATEKMAGEWYVTVVAIDNAGKVVYEDADLYGLGKFHLDTYNTSENGIDSMWIDDIKNFWDFKVKMNVDASKMTFSANSAKNTKYDCLVNITDGKVLYGAATTPTGSKADSIVFTVSFSDDTAPTKYGFAAYRIAGYRYTGLKKDE